MRCWLRLPPTKNLQDKTQTNELVNIGVVALDMNKYTFTEGHVVLHCNQHPVATKYATLMMMNPKGRNQKIKINLENFKFGRGEIRSDDLPVKEPGFLPTCLQHFGAGLVYFELME